MKIIIANDYEDMSRKAANYLSAQVIMKPDAVLGLATGETPIGAYKRSEEHTSDSSHNRESRMPSSA